MFQNDYILFSHKLEPVQVLLITEHLVGSHLHWCIWSICSDVSQYRSSNGIEEIGKMIDLKVELF